MLLSSAGSLHPLTGARLERLLQLNGARLHLLRLQQRQRQHTNEFASMAALGTEGCQVQLTTLNVTSMLVGSTGRKQLGTAHLLSRQHSCSAVAVRLILQLALQHLHLRLLCCQILHKGAKREDRAVYNKHCAFKSQP